MGFFQIQERTITNKRLQIDVLDGLRGFAALLVVFSHTSNEDIFLLPFLDFGGLGKAGVFLFFILSSFLLTIPLFAKGTGCLSKEVMTNYWQRRFFRIYPLYFLYLLMAVVTSFALSHVPGFEGRGLPFYLDLYGLLNHLLLIEGKRVTWSIAVEFKFYFVLPIIVFLIYRADKISIKLTPIVLLVFLIITQVFYPENESLRNDPRLLPYMPIFIFGVGLAIFYYKTQDYNLTGNLKTTLIGISVVALICLTLMSPSIYSNIFSAIDHNHFHKDFILHSILWSIIIFSAIKVKSFVRTIFNFSILRYFGALSFSIYLFHPIFIALTKLTNVHPSLKFMFVLAGSTLLSHISYKYLEEPISRFKLLK